MIELSKIPEQVANSLGRPFLKWLMEDRTRTNTKIDVVSSPTAGNVPTLDANGELEDSSKAAPTGDFVGTTDTQTLTNKTLTTPTIGSFVNATHNHEAAAGGGTLDEDALALTDVTTNNASTTKHGFCPKLSNDGTQFLAGDGTWVEHDATARHGDAVLFSTAMTDYSATSTIVGWSSFTIKEVWYKKIGKTVFVWYRLEGTSNNTATTFTVPAATKATAPAYVNLAYGQDSGTGVVAVMALTAGSSTVTLYNGVALAAWTASGTKKVNGMFTYEAAS